MSYFNKVLSHINRFKVIGTDVLTDGTILIGKAPHIAPQAWLHKIFPVLQSTEIESIEKKIGYKIPKSYSYFLTHYSNGLKIFLDTLSLDGLRKQQGRSIENAWQPYSIFTPNTIERIKNAQPNHFFIGGYNWDGSLLYIDDKTGNVHRCSRNSVKPLNTWVSFEDMLLSETERITLLFDENGIQKEEDKPTIPFT